MTAVAESPQTLRLMSARLRNLASKRDEGAAATMRMLSAIGCSLTSPAVQTMADEASACRGAAEILESMAIEREAG